MAACPRCGYENPDVAERCENPDCRADLRPLVATPPRVEERATPPPWVEEPSAAPPWVEEPSVAPSGLRSPRRPSAAGPTPPPSSSSHPPPASGPSQPTESPPGEQRKGVRVSAEPLDLRVEPGGPPVSTTVTVCNTGTRVEDFHLAVNGPVAGFARVHPPVLHAFPERELTAQVQFAVPRAPHPAAGRYSFQIVARALVDADVSGRVAGGLTVGRFDEMAASIEPEMTRGRRPGHHRVTVVNKGNGPLDVRVAMADQQGELTFNPSRFGGMVANGATATEPLVVSAPLKWFGRTQVHPFSAKVDTDVRGQMALVQARRRQVPRFPWWVPTMALALVALGIALYAIIPGATVPPVDGQNVAQATATLKDAGYETVVPIEQPHPSILAGLAIETKPAANAEHPKDKAVMLLVSRGPCTGNCPIPIPVVDGLQVEEAKTALATAGFVVERVNQVPDQRPPGTVVGTIPPGGQEVAANEKVVINAALGPAATATPGPSAPPSAPPGGPGTPGGPGASGGPGVPVTVSPALVGKPGPEVVKALTDLGLKVTQVRTHSNARALNEVLSITPPPGGPVAPGSPVTIELAVPTAVNLVDAAPTALWSDQTGALVFAPPPPPPSGAPSVPGGLTLPARGAAFLHPPTTVLEDDTPASAVAMEPSPNGRVTGAFTLPQPVIVGDRVRALVGVLPGAAGTVEFSVTANGILLNPVITDTSADGALKLLDVDLGPVVGATALQVSVKPTVPESVDNRAFLKDLRIEGLIG